MGSMQSTQSADAPPSSSNKLPNIIIIIIDNGNSFILAKGERHAQEKGKAVKRRGKKTNHSDEDGQQLLCRCVGHPCNQPPAAAPPAAMEVPLPSAPPTQYCTTA